MSSQRSEAVEFLVQARSRNLSERRPIETAADDAKPVPQPGRQDFDDGIVGVRRPWVAIQCHADSDSPLTSLDERGGEPAVPQVVGHPIDRPTRWNASDPKREQVAQQPDRTIRAAKVNLIVTHRRTRPRRDAAIFSLRSGTS